MKHKNKIIITLLVILIIGAAIFWWANNKKSIIKNGIQSTVLSKSDSLYKISYDSSYFDEVNGNAILYNVNIKVDSAILNRVVRSDTVPGIIANVHIRSISIQGLKSLQLLAGTSIDVEKIQIESPEITLKRLSLSSPTETKAVTNDSTEIYKLILGHFDYIRAKNISINNATFNYRDTLQKQFANIGNISISINDINISKENGYKQVIAYFVKNTTLSVKDLIVEDKTKKTVFTLDSLYYNSLNGKLSFNGFTDNKQKIKLLSFSGLNTYDFILKKRFNSRTLSIENLSLDFQETTPQPSPKNKNKKDSIGLGVNNFLLAVNVDTLLLRNATVSIKDNETETIKILGIDAMLPHIQFDSTLVLLKDYLHTKVIDFSFKEVTITPKNSLHSLNVSNIVFNGTNKKLTIDKLHFAPIHNKDVTMKMVGHPVDLYYVDAKKITAMDCNIFDVFFNNSIAASSVTGSVNFTIYNDKTFPNIPATKFSEYPQQKLQLAKINIDIPFIKITDSRVAYEEKSSASKMTSQVPFYSVTGTIRNVHNRQNLSQPLLVDIQSKFLNQADFTTHWTLPYNNSDGKFNINGTVGAMDLTAANPIAKNMGLVDVKQGKLQKMAFNIDGNKLITHGKMSILYDDVKADMLKLNTETDSLEKQGVKSFIGGLLLHKKNTDPKYFDYDYNAKMGDSFFGTAWSSIFAGLKKVAL